MAHQNDEFVNIPGNTSTGHLSIVSLELSFNMFSLSLEIFFCPNITVQFGIVYKRHTFLCGLLNITRRNLFLMNSKEAVLLRVIPEDSNAWHLLIE